jgi:hypothetical protein
MIKMKNTLLFFVTALLSSSVSLAFLPMASITSMTLPVYGVYMTSDASCATGLTATVPLSTTPTSTNFVAKPIIGSAGSFPATIGCVVVVIQNNFSGAWSAGTYTGTSTSGGTNSDNIAACNNGGSQSGQTICNSGVPGWPAKITADAAAIGLTLKTSNCSAHTTSDVVPLVLSTYSVCSGNSLADTGIAACASGTNNFAVPQSGNTADAANGTKMTAPSTSGSLKFIVNPTNSFGATTATTCGNTSAPLFSFAAY